MRGVTRSLSLPPTLRTSRSRTPTSLRKTNLLGPALTIEFSKNVNVKTYKKTQVEETTETALMPSPELPPTRGPSRSRSSTYLRTKLPSSVPTKSPELAQSINLFCETLTRRLWRKTSVETAAPEVEHRVQTGCQHVALHHRTKVAQEFRHNEENINVETVKKDECVEAGKTGNRTPS